MRPICVAACIWSSILLLFVLTSNSALSVPSNGSISGTEENVIAILKNNATLLNKTIAGVVNKTVTEIINKTVSPAEKKAAGAEANVTAILKKAAGAIAAVANISKPANSTQIVRAVFGEDPARTATTILITMALLILIPLVGDMVLAYFRNTKRGDRGLATAPTGMPGLYRALMTFGLIIMVGAIVFYVIGLVTVNISSAGPQAFTAVTNTLTNLSTILGTALASVVAFYFGTRATEKGVEKGIAGVRPSSSAVPPEVVNITPGSGQRGVQANSPVAVTFSKPIRSSTLTPNTFYIKDKESKRVTGYIQYSDDGKVVTFVPDPPLAGKSDYTLTISKGVTDVEGNAMISESVSIFSTD